MIYHQAKYFPPEAHDRLEGAFFLDLRQGKKTVREYVAKFNSLKNHDGRELRSERKQVGRFMRGLRVELRKTCQIRDYELVEKASQLDSTPVEEARLAGNAAAG